MKIVHLCVADRFADNHSYQVNNLIKFHKIMGMEVEVIASRDTFNEKGEFVHNYPAGSYIGENGIKVTRLPFIADNRLYWRLKKLRGLDDALKTAQPDILFIHGCQFMDMDIVIHYLKKHPSIRVYVDNHADFSNSATNWFSKNIVHKIIWRHTAQLVEPYTTKFYGVLPARVEFLKNMYKLPTEKCELLVMGADDDLVEAAAKPEVRATIRQKYHIADDDFLIMTGGKIDQFKTQTLLLMKAVQKINNPKVKLIVFGSIATELKEQVAALADGSKVQNIGWIQAKDSYQYFASADLVVFPGRHSVFWEQVAAQGIPMLCKKWEGTTHVDVGGNVIFLEKDSVEEIQEAIENLLNHPMKYHGMKDIALQNGKKTFLYSDIAKRCIEE